LLDEIGELDPLLQAKLLRVLQEGELDRLGGKNPIKINVRVIATTNRNLEELVQKKSFRTDLFYRLYGLRFQLPSVSKRLGDVTLLAERFLKRQEISQGRKFEFSAEVLPALQEMEWPGNIRELEMAIERASVMSEGNIIELKHFEFSELSKPSSRADFSETGKIVSSKKSMREREMEIILDSLEAHDGNRTHAAKSLGMSLRTLRHKLKQYREDGVEIPENERSGFYRAKVGNKGEKWR
jgi:transcriptional regulator with PAS, ATPase and Fis domain